MITKFKLFEQSDEDDPFGEETPHGDLSGFDNLNSSDTSFNPNPPRRRRRPNARDTSVIDRERAERLENELNILKSKCPSAFISNARGYNEFLCDAYEFNELVMSGEASFAGNVFEEDTKLGEILENLSNYGATNFKVGAIIVGGGSPWGTRSNDFVGDALYFNEMNHSIRQYIENLNPDEKSYYQENNICRLWWD